ncbi:hypothetical protein SH449x_004687 [Pirellulaceae bacterium SH449]
MCILIFTFDSGLAEIKRTNFASLFAERVYAELFYYRSIFGSRQNPAKSPQAIPRSDIVAQGYDLSINRYKEVVHEEVDYRAPQAILDELPSIEKVITQGMKQLRGMIESGK